jgi:putative tryptophan/tyrosine transport system substrate-binding protein
MTAINPELGAKRLQVLHQLGPKAAHIAALRNPADEVHALDLKATQAAASELGASLQAFDLHSPAEVDPVFERIVKSKPDALVVFNDAITVAARPRIVQLAALHRIPAMYEAREWAAAGGLLAYGVTHVDLFRQCASHVDKILKGAKPADLPVEQPTRIRLTVNLKAARALGIAMPQSLLLRADEVIE